MVRFDEDSMLVKIKKIMDSAKNPECDDGVSFDLSPNQAISIMVRSNQLVQEGKSYNQKAKARQIEECYKQRENK